MNKRNLIYSGFSALFALCFSLGVACATWGQDVPSPPNPVVPTPSKPVPWVLLPQGQPLITPPVPSSMEWDGTNIWLTGKDGTRGTIFSGNAPATFNTTVTFGSSGILDFSSGSVINFADGSVWKSTGLVFGTGTTLSFPDGSAWGSGGLSFGTTGTETLPDGSTWTSSGLTTPSGKTVNLSASNVTLPASISHNPGTTTQVYTSSGSLTLPSNVSVISVTMCGGGGAGTTTPGSSTVAYVNPSGNSASCFQGSINLGSAGQVLTVTVGSAGTYVSGAAGGSGTASSIAISGSNVVTAAGGIGYPKNTSTCSIPCNNVLQIPTPTPSCTLGPTGTAISSLCTTGPQIYESLLSNTSFSLLVLEGQPNIMSKCVSMYYIPATSSFPTCSGFGYGGPPTLYDGGTTTTAGTQNNGGPGIVIVSY